MPWLGKQWFWTDHALAFARWVQTVSAGLEAEAARRWCGQCRVYRYDTNDPHGTGDHRPFLSG